MHVIPGWLHGGTHNAGHGVAGTTVAVGFPAGLPVAVGVACGAAAGSTWMMIQGVGNGVAVGTGVAVGGTLMTIGVAAGGHSVITHLCPVAVGVACGAGALITGAPIGGMPSVGSAGGAPPADAAAAMLPKTTAMAMPMVPKIQNNSPKIMPITATTPLTMAMIQGMPQFARNQMTRTARRIHTMGIV